MKPEFQRVVLYARQHRANEGIVETLHRLVSFLEGKGLETFLDEETIAHFSIDLPGLEASQLGKKNDLIIVVGGDGSLLSAARMAIQVNVPVIGINRGRLGFLTDILPQEIELKLNEVLEGRYQEEERFLLHAKIHDEHHNTTDANRSEELRKENPSSALRAPSPRFRSEGIKEEGSDLGDALNDVVLSRGSETHLVEFEMYINEQYVCHYRSDGLIISTPTGSTAYALSAGGPIMHPNLNAMLIVPLFSHSLSSRPLVIDGDAKIDLIISKKNETNLMVSCDGHESRLVKQGQQISVVKNSQQLRLLHPLDYHYYDTLRIKLGWQLKNNA